MSSESNQVFTLVSRHFSFLPLSLSRYKRQWFLTYPRAYGMVAYPGQRIFCTLNTPDSTVDSTYASRHFWLNATFKSEPYNPDSDGDKKFVGSPIHMLLDSENQGVRLTGRMRTESSNYPPEHGKDIVCYEVEVLFPDEGLLRQCYYCLCWEACGPIRRFSQYGDDTFWCEECEKRGQTASFFSGFAEKMYYDSIASKFIHGSQPRDSLYH
ncbi:uncharacterized protein STEHIDRAFT_156905 [Stereum hirsutum FP-91666 SS1]|uniref:uncharacterized protein n=1 Tax=Stereum hirsutum (strain FP-91666) TaxID=721885 RepID=UPI000440ECF8|nr:uncharacterized protein STEHIDRAFT_156905 [Stereum hirsutum FP-91666 SS1]EIM86599.1 hypothetical protein STEHIDRAFT_156905 [Stereum hirsutum FP-91666 SS1]